MELEKQFELAKTLMKWRNPIIENKGASPSVTPWDMARQILEAQSKAIPDEKMVEIIRKFLVGHFYNGKGVYSKRLWTSYANQLLSQLNIPARIEAARKEEREKWACELEDSLNCADGDYYSRSKETIIKLRR